MCIVNMDKAFSKMSVSCSDHTWILREMTGNNHQAQQFEVESTFTSVFINFGWGENNVSLGECLVSISLDIFIFMVVRILRLQQVSKESC